MRKIKYYSVDEAAAIVAADETLKFWAEKLRSEDEENYLDYGNDYFDLCSNTDDESDNRVWLDIYKHLNLQLEHFDEADDCCYSIVGLSIEQALLIGRDILAAVAI
jgi:hypothetical protein